MQVSLMPQNYKNNRMNSVPAFGQKYPYADVMSLISGTHVAGNQESYTQTIKALIKQINVKPSFDDLSNHLFMRNHIQNAKGFEQLRELATQFRNAFNATGISQFNLSPKKLPK